MKGPQIAAGFAVLCAALWSSGALAETKRQERVTVTGCAYAGVTGTCLMIKGPTGTGLQHQRHRAAAAPERAHDPRPRQRHRQDERVRRGRRARPHPLDAHAAAMPELSGGAG